jgi:uncharacterized protein YhhL (DUF1145 family)
MHEINLILSVHFYIDVSMHAIELVITQFQNAKIVNISEKDQIEVFIVYDSIALVASRRKYLTYKKKLYAIVIFVFKYDYLCKHSFISSIIHTNHKSLTRFLKSDLHEKIYEH